MIACHQVRCGIAAFGVGPLVDAGADVSTLYGCTAVVATTMVLLAVAIARRQPTTRLTHASRAGPGENATHR